MNTISVKISKIIGVLTIGLAFAGCALGPPHFKRSVEVSNIFEQFILQAGYQYYYNGHHASPNAVVAIQKAYTLKSVYWHPADPSPKELRNWVEKMQNIAGAEYNLDPNGAYILNDQGDRIGFWYSVWTLPKLTFQSDNLFSISNPMTIFPRRNRDPEEKDMSPLFH